MPTAEQQAAFVRAADRAKAVLKPGDRLYVQRCGGIRCTVTFTGWDRNWVCSKTLDDISARNILRVNGKPVSFADEGEA